MPTGLMNGDIGCRSEIAVGSPLLAWREHAKPGWLPGKLAVRVFVCDSHLDALPDGLFRLGTTALLERSRQAEPQLYSRGWHSAIPVFGGDHLVPAEQLQDDGLGWG